MAMILMDTPRCPHCHESSVVSVDEHAFARWRKGELIQNAFPDLTPEQRELLQTGFHPACWEEMLADDDPEDDFIKGLPI